MTFAQTALARNEAPSHIRAKVWEQFEREPRSVYVSAITDEIIRVLENVAPKELMANEVYDAGSFESIQPVYAALATMSKKEDGRLLRISPVNGGKYKYALNPNPRKNGEITSSVSKAVLADDRVSPLAKAIVAGVKHEPVKPITADAVLHTSDKEIGGHANVSPPTDPRPASASAVPQTLAVVEVPTLQDIKGAVDVHVAPVKPSVSSLNLSVRVQGNLRYWESLLAERDALVERITVIDARLEILAKWIHEDSGAKE